MSKRKRSSCSDNNPKKKKRVRFKGTKVFLTYPQNDIDKNVLVDNILEAYPNKIEWIVASNEDHAPSVDYKSKETHGGVHAHVVFKFRGGQEWLYHDVLDKIGGNKHGHYSTMKGTMLEAFSYICKDGDYTSWGFDDFEERMKTLKRKKSPKSDQVMDLIDNGATDEDLLANPKLKGFVGFNIRKIDDIRAKKAKIAIEKKIKPIYGPLDNISPELNLPSHDLMWNIDKQVEIRAHREQNIYIYTPTKVGKSVLFKQLQRRYRCFTMGRNHLLEGYEDGKYDIIICDEFAPGHCSITDLNYLTGGSDVKDPKNRYNAAIKRDNLLVIILTNYIPSQIWPDKYGSVPWDAFMTRWQFLRFTEDQPIRCWFDPLYDLFVQEESHPIPDWANAPPPDVLYVS